MSVIYVGNLDNDATVRDLHSELDRYGKIKDIWIARNPPGFAFVEFDNQETAKDAVRGTDGKTILKNKVRVEVSKRTGARSGKLIVDSDNRGSERDNRDRRDGDRRDRSRDRAGRDEDRGGRDRDRDFGRDRDRNTRDRSRSRDRNDRDRNRDRTRDPSIRNDRNNADRNNTDRNNDRDRSRDRTRDPVNRNTDRRPRDRSRDHNRDRDRERDRERSRSRDRYNNRNPAGNNNNNNRRDNSRERRERNRERDRNNNRDGNGQAREKRKRPTREPRPAKVRSEHRALLNNIPAVYCTTWLVLKEFLKQFAEPVYVDVAKDGTATAEFATSEEADLVVTGLTNTPVDGITVVAVRDTELRLNKTTEPQANGNGRNQRNRGNNNSTNNNDNNTTTMNDEESNNDDSDRQRRDRSSTNNSPTTSVPTSPAHHTTTTANNTTSSVDNGITSPLLSYDNIYAEKDDMVISGGHNAHSPVHHTATATIADTGITSPLLSYDNIYADKDDEVVTSDGHNSAYRGTDGDLEVDYSPDVEVDVTVEPAAEETGAMDEDNVGKNNKSQAKDKAPANKGKRRR